MTCDSSVPRLDVILPALSSRFADNVIHSLAASSTDLEAIEIRARAIALIGELLAAEGPSPHRLRLTKAFDEVFADLILSCYFCAAGLDIPASSVLRRAFETGIAIGFLWDSPFAFWGWTEHDKDLNFREMVEFVASDNYRTLLKEETTMYQGEVVINSGEAESLYRILSNVTHGKWTTFESSLPDRFSHNLKDWTLHIERLAKIEAILLTVYRLRFSSVLPELLRRMPIMERF